MRRLIYRNLNINMKVKSGNIVGNFNMVNVIKLWVDGIRKLM